jgi:hypothetical protein
MELIAFVLALAGFTALALAMRRHHRDLFGRFPSVKRSVILRVVGGTALILSLAPCVFRADWPVGLVLWLGLLTVSALAVALMFAYRPATWQQKRMAFPPPACADVGRGAHRRGPSAS